MSDTSKDKTTGDLNPPASGHELFKKDESHFQVFFFPEI